MTEEGAGFRASGAGVEPNQTSGTRSELLQQTAKLDCVVEFEAARILRDTHDARPIADLDRFEEQSLATGSNRRIVCAACRHPITAERNRIAVNGAAEHTCVNPHGITFHIGCFAAAPGCCALGVPTTDFTWFRGFAWSYALCGTCGTLLGWRYQGSGAKSFFGLILNRLVVESRS